MGERLRLSEFIPGAKWLEYASVRLAVGLINLLPLRASSWLARRLGDLLYAAMPKRRSTAFENLTRAYGDALDTNQKQALARESFRNVVTSLIEFFRIPRMLRESKERFHYEGTEHLDAAFQKGRGVIWVVSHLGSWEYLAFLPYLRGHPCSVVVRAVRNPHLYRWIQELRMTLHLNPIDRKNSIREVLGELKKNHLVAILIDQWAGREGVWGDFFGEPTSTTSIPARLARRTGAALIPAYCLRTGHGTYHFKVLREVPLDPDSARHEEKTTALLNQILEAEILKYPEQWVWTHRRWKGLDRYIPEEDRVP